MSGVDASIVAAIIGAAATIGAEALGRVPARGRRSRMREELELLKLFDEVDDGSKAMDEVRRELVGALCEDVRRRRDEGVLALVSRNHPFLLFFSVWLVSYLSLGGAVDGEHVLSVCLLCVACCLLDVAGHAYQVIARGRD